MTINLDQFETSIKQRDYRRAVHLLHDLLSSFGHLSNGNDFSLTEYQRLTLAVSELFIQRDFLPDYASYQLLCSHHASLEMLFKLAGHSNADYVICQIADIDANSGFHFKSQAELLKCLLLFSLSSSYNLDIHRLSRQMPDIIAPLLIGLLGCRTMYNGKTLSGYNRLLEQDWHHIEGYQPVISDMLGLSNAWMYCSYADSPKKHTVKSTLNRILGNWSLLPAASVHSEKVVSTGRLRILIPLESFASDHAMYRCFERAIRNLTDSFHTIGLAPEHCVDNISKQCFTETLLFKPGEPFQHTVEFMDKLHGLNCDMVYYPSLGMANYTLMLATQRLAPVQCFTLGHPATSYFPEIDYAIVQQQDFTDVDIYSEKVILTGNETSSTLNQALIAKQVKGPADSDICHIAITSTYMKINHHFLEACRIIKERCNRDIRFHIFPAVSGHLLQHLSEAYQAMLGDVVVYPATDYETYIHRLSQCSVRLGTFPFGGANSNMDCFGLAMPFVALTGREPHAQSDVGQLQQAELPELIANNHEDYIQKALKLLEDHDYYNKVRAKMQTLKDNPFFNGNINQQKNFTDTVAWILEHHNDMKVSDKRVWTLEEQHVP